MGFGRILFPRALSMNCLPPMWILPNNRTVMAAMVRKGRAVHMALAVLIHLMPLAAIPIQHQAGKRAQSRDPQGQRANAAKNNWGTRSGANTGSNPKTINGELVASSVNEAAPRFKVGERVFHMKFGNGNVALVDGNKLTIDFDKAGQKRVLESFCRGGLGGATLNLPQHKQPQCRR